MKVTKIFLPIVVLFFFSPLLAKAVSCRAIFAANQATGTKEGLILQELHEQQLQRGRDFRQHFRSVGQRVDVFDIIASHRAKLRRSAGKSRPMLNYSPDGRWLLIESEVPGEVILVDTQNPLPTSVRTIKINGASSETEARRTHFYFHDEGRTLVINNEVKEGENRLIQVQAFDLASGVPKYDTMSFTVADSGRFDRFDIWDGLMHLRTGIKFISSFTDNAVEFRNAVTGELIGRLNRQGARSLELHETDKGLFVYAFAEDGSLLGFIDLINPTEPNSIGVPNEPFGARVVFDSSSGEAGRIELTAANGSLIEGAPHFNLEGLEFEKRDRFFQPEVGIVPGTSLLVLSSLLYHTGVHHPRSKTVIFNIETGEPIVVMDGRKVRAQEIYNSSPDKKYFVDGDGVGSSLVTKEGEVLLNYGPDEATISFIGPAKALIYLTENQTFQVVDLDQLARGGGFNSSWTFPPIRDLDAKMHFSPDGNSLYYLNEDDEPQLVVPGRR